MSFQSHNSNRAPEPVGPYPHAKRVGQYLYLSGVGPRAKGEKDIPGVTLDANEQIIDYDIEKQCRACFENLRIILEDAGSSWNDLVDVLVFLTNMKDDFKIYNHVYKEYFDKPNGPYPSRTTIEINKLPTPIAVEVKAIAYLQKTMPKQ